MESSKLASVVVKTEQLLAGLGEEKLKELAKSLDISFEEHFVWQTKKSELQASGQISLADAMYLYEVIGGSCDVFNRRSAAQKYVISQFMLVVLKPKS